MKKILLLLLSLVLVLTLVGCGPAAPAEKDAPEKDVQEEVKEEKQEKQEEPEKKDEAEAKEEEAEAPAAAGEANLALNYEEATPEDYEGVWKLKAAYLKDTGLLEVPEGAISLDMKVQVEINKLVDADKYLHADATNLQAKLSFDHPEIDVDPYKCSGAYDDFTKFVVVGEGECYSKGAVKFKIRDDDEGLFFDVLTGTELDDPELMKVIGLNSDGELVLGYSEDHIERDDEAEFEYAYIFTKAS